MRQRSGLSITLRYPPLHTRLRCHLRPMSKLHGRYEKSGMPPGRRCACPARQRCDTEVGTDLVLDAVFLRRCPILSQLGF